MKTYYICDKAKGTCRNCGNTCTMTADPKHARNKNKRERYFVVDPIGEYMQEVETAEQMERAAREIIKLLKNNVAQCHLKK